VISKEFFWIYQNHFLCFKQIQDNPLPDKKQRFLERKGNGQSLITN